MDVVILTRVSKDSQSYERQILDLSNYSEKMGYDVKAEFNEKITGIAKNENRKALIDLIQYLDNNPQIDKVLVWELSRLGRSTLEVLKTVDEFHKRNVSLYVHNYNIETLNQDKSINPLAQILVTMLAEFARSERATTQQRLFSGYVKHRSENGRVGRIPGAVMSNERLLEKHPDVVKYLRKGRSIRETGTLANKSTRTVQKVKEAMMNKNIHA